MWDLIVSVPDHCLSFYFVVRARSGKIIRISVFISFIKNVTYYF